MKIRILWPGKTKKEYYRDAIKDYANRIGKFVPIEIIEVREERLQESQRARRIRSESSQLSSKRRSGTTVVLDPLGKMMTSEQFSLWLNNISGSVDFFLGGPAGLMLDQVSLCLSFGRMTLPHELARVVLVEQIYRALTIQHNLPYHK